MERRVRSFGVYSGYQSVYYIDCTTVDDIDSVYNKVQQGTTQPTTEYYTLFTTVEEATEQTK